MEDVREDEDTVEATNEDAMEAARTTMPCAAVEDIIISARRLSLQHPTLDSVDPGTKITWPALAPQFLYPSKSEMRSWPWPTSKSPPPQAENDDSDKKVIWRQEKMKKRENKLMIQIQTRKSLHTRN